jgi:hypothetical protein
MGSTTKNKIVYMVGRKGQDINLGHPTTKRLGRPKPLSILQERK